MEEAESQSRLRRYRDTLSTSGLAIIIFSVWDLVKGLLTTIYGSSLPTHDEGFAETLEPTLESLRHIDKMLLVGMVLALLAIMLLALVLRFYVGLSARAEAHGKRKSWAYVIATGFMAAVSAVGLVMGALISRSTPYVLGAIATGAVELTSFLAYVDLIRSAVMVKRLTRQQPEGR